MEKINKWEKTLNFSLYKNLILSKIPKRNTTYDITNVTNDKIDIIIDLSTQKNSYDIPTNSKYYQFKFEKKKILEDDKINLIMNILDKNRDKKILIHCHYGFNRTGFVFVNYLCNDGYKLNEALNIFTKLRGRGIKYIELLTYLKNKFE
tara:strand:- start:364 stop:810 length:447 start_codon:yes stop_codon:yes gene_type:complete